MNYCKIREVKSPNRGSSQSAGIDIFIPTDIQHEVKTEGVIKEWIIRPGHSAVIPAGLIFDVPEGHALIAMNKSGVAVKKNLVIGACVIDEDYQGEGFRVQRRYPQEKQRLRR